MISPDERLWVAAIAANPADSLVRLVYADWLEERGRERAASFWRWAAEAGLKPKHGSYFDADPWAWGKLIGRVEKGGCCIPASMFDNLDRRKWGHLTHGRWYEDALVAFLDLASAADAYQPEVAHV